MALKIRNFLVNVSPGSAETLIKLGGIANHHSIAYSCSSKMYFVLALCLYCFYSLLSFLVMFYSYHIDVQLSHLNKDYLLTYLLSISAKNYQNRLICIEVIMCYISVVFWDTVYTVASTLLLEWQKEDHRRRPLWSSVARFPLDFQQFIFCLTLGLHSDLVWLSLLNFTVCDHQLL